MTPIEWVASDPVLVSAFDQSGRLFCPHRAFTVLDQSDRYHDLAQALGPSEIPDDVDKVESIRRWLLAQPGAYSPVVDLLAAPASLDV